MWQEGRPPLNALTGARFLAAFWVLMYHFAIQFRFDALPGKAPSSGALPLGLAPVILQGHIAVDFFFILSGFILSYTYVTSEGELRGSRRQFWVARIARIYPVYVLGLVLGLEPFLKLEPNLAIVAFSGFTHLLMLHSWIPVALDWDQPVWSLGVEATFYAAFPAIVPLAGRLRRRGLWLLLLGAWLAFLTICLILQALTDAGFSTLLGWRDIVRYNPVVSFPEFVVGIALGLLFLRYGSVIPSSLRRMRGWVFDGLIAAMLALLVAALVALENLNLANADVDIGAPVTLPMLAALILLLAHQRGALARILSTGPLIWLGEISYAVYVLHKPLWYLLSGPLWSAVDAVSLASARRPASNLALFAAFVALVIACAGLSFRCLERPLRRLIRMRWGQPPAAARAGEAAVSPSSAAGYKR